MEKPSNMETIVFHFPILALATYKRMTMMKMMMVVILSRFLVLATARNWPYCCFGSGLFVIPDLEWGDDDLF